MLHDLIDSARPGEQIEITGKVLRRLFAISCLRSFRFAFSTVVRILFKYSLNGMKALLQSTDSRSISSRGIV